MPGVTELSVQLSVKGEQQVYRAPTWATKPNGVVVLVYYKSPDQLTPAEMTSFKVDLGRLSHHICNKTAPLEASFLRNIGSPYFTDKDVSKIKKFTSDFVRSMWRPALRRAIRRMNLGKVIAAAFRGRLVPRFMPRFMPRFTRSNDDVRGC
jgi:hypothetical protein